MNDIQKIKDEFNKKFPELWSSNDGREGYDRHIEDVVLDFLIRAIDISYNEGRKDENKAWLRRERCSLCGGIMKSEITSDTCYKCFETA